MMKPCHECHALIPANQWLKHQTGHANSRPGKRDLSWGNTEWRRIRRQVLERDDYTCLVCRRTKEQLKALDLQLHVHHLVEASKGGTDDLSNLETRCEEHHDRGGHRPRANGM